MPLPFPHAGYSEDVPLRVRVLFNGKFVADAPQPKLFWESAYYPWYYLPLSTVLHEHLQNPVSESNNAESGAAEPLSATSAPKKTLIYDLVVGERSAPRAVTVFGADKGEGLVGFVKIKFDAADAWLEEDERIYVHPKDPYKRVHILPSSKHIRVEIDGVEVANSIRSRRLFETGLPVRTYIPITDVRLDLLTPSSLVTACPYKGEANYYDVQTPKGKREGLVWWYKTPTEESTPIRGLVAFYDEKVDVWVDGKKQDTPVTKFS